jgi:hypothetical protein
MAATLAAKGHQVVLEVKVHLALHVKPVFA